MMVSSKTSWGLVCFSSRPFGKNEDHKGEGCIFIHFSYDRMIKNIVLVHSCTIAIFRRTILWCEDD